MTLYYKDCFSINLEAVDHVWWCYHEKEIILGEVNSVLNLADGRGIRQAYSQWDAHLATFHAVELGCAPSSSREAAHAGTTTWTLQRTAQVLQR